MRKFRDSARAPRPRIDHRTLESAKLCLSCAALCTVRVCSQLVCL